VFLRGKPLKLNELGTEQRRIAVDAIHRRSPSPVTGRKINALEDELTARANHFRDWTG
jgi:hypothetical protein